MSLRTAGVMILAAVFLFVAMIAWHPAIKGSSPEAQGRTQTPAQSSPESAGPASSQPAGPVTTPVLIELFTSEGCSSCPPADALLSRLGRTQPVSGADLIVLEEHVDYWDRLGWKDPFSSPAMTERQSEYGESFGGQQVYTPQMIVDGHAKFVGSSEQDALSAIRAVSASPKPFVRLAWAESNMLTIHVDPLMNATRGDNPDVLLVIAENMLHSDVKHGENAGRALNHDGVVRQLSTVGEAHAGATPFSSNIEVQAQHDWNRSNLRAVVFVQERRSRRVLAAAAIPFPAE